MDKLLRWGIVLCYGALLLVSLQVIAQQPKISDYDRGVAQQMLHDTVSDLKKYYYDTTFHGMNIDARFEKVQKDINAAPSLNYAMSSIAAAVADLNDSHSFFSPPPRPYTHDYGWRMQALGNKGIFITAVRPESDAEKKGVHPGDQILQLNGYEPTREILWQMEYVYWSLRPQPSLHLRLKTPDGTIREVDTQAYMRQTRLQRDLTDDIDRHQFQLDYQREISELKPRSKALGDVFVLKLYSFAWPPDYTEEVLHLARTKPILVLDLRGNPGGIIKSLTNFVGGFFDHEVKVSDRVGRKPMKAEVAKPYGKTYTGKLIVLIDSKSASAAELFARMVQLQGRGTVIGDLSAGAVMESRSYPHSIGTSTIVPYSMSVTEADLIMPDGKSLEHVGVVPDKVMLPSPEDLAAGRDPVLAYAVEQAGGQLSPEEAGKLFPVYWPPK
jgi:carboxyl-terminal processing protease